MVRTEREMVGVYGPVILTAQPVMRGFIFRYLLSFTPIITAALSLFVMLQMHELVKGFPPPTGELPAGGDAGSASIHRLCVLLIVPVGVFLFFIWLGDAIHRPEIWTGTGLTLLLSGVGARVIVYRDWISRFFLPDTCLPSSSGWRT